jgi:phosphoserine phosphatase
MKKVAIFDLDHCLVEVNTSFEFVRYVFKKEKQFFKLFLLYFQKLLIPFLVFFFPSKTDREFYLKFLKGLSREILGHYAEEFAFYTTQNFLNKRLYEEINKFKEKREFVLILASSGFDTVVESISKKLGFDFYLGSAIEYDRNNICTGNLKTKLDKKKLEFLEKLIFPQIGKIDLRNSYFYTDNLSDIDLAKVIGNSFGVVQYSREAKLWTLHNIPVIYKIPVFKNYNYLFLPTFYYFIVRFPTNLIGNIYYHLFFPFIFSILISSFSIKNILIFLLAFWGYVALYEIGYILNDCVAVKKEEKPSIRIDPNSFFCKKKNIAIFIRAVFFLFIFILLIYLTFNVPYLFFISNFLILAIFLIVNNLKQQTRKFLYPFLASSHLVLPPLVFNPHPLFLLPIVLYNFMWHFIYAFEKFIAKPNKKITLISLPKILLLFLLVGFSYLKPDLVNYKVLLLSFLLCVFDFLYLLKFSLIQLKMQFKKS